VATFPDIDEPELESPAQGSAAWHALLFTPAPARTALVAAFTCGREIGASARRSQETLVGSVRLAWWREEAGLLADGRPRHPATRRLAGALTDPGPAAEAIGAMISAAGRDLQRQRFEDFDALLAHCAEEGGGLYELAALATSGTRLSPEAGSALRSLGTADRLVEMIRSLHQDVLDGRYYLPGRLVTEAGIVTDDWLRPGLTAGLREVLATTAEQARRCLYTGATQLPEDERPGAVSVLVLAALRARLLERLTRRRFEVIGHWTELSGWRKLLTAWNAARRGLQGRPPRLPGIRR
jgi:phytoene/squalene synthetase